MTNLTLEVTHPPYLVMSSDFSQQEPKITATVSQDPKLIDAFIHGRDVYATISSIALGVPYEECLEFHPVTGEVQPEGKARRSIGKVLNLGITYGMSVPSIAESLFSDREDMTEDQKLKEAQRIQDSLMKGFPHLAKSIANAQRQASQVGYTETILGRRRHHPNMMLPKFEFEPMPGYVNPDIDPLDPESLQNKEQIPKRIVQALTKEFNSYKWYGKIVKRTKELAEQKIKVINNSYKIEEASRQVFNCVDKETEILTKEGWKKYNEVKVGDEILSYSVEMNQIEYDRIEDLHIYEGPTEAISFETNDISAISTPHHKWITRENNTVCLKSTSELIRQDRSFEILRMNDSQEAEFTTVNVDQVSEVTLPDGVWCVTTRNHTWIARRNDLTYFTGNSIIQGSAADLTKMAMLRLEHDPEWKKLNGRFLVPVHDELICEVPMENIEEGAKCLSRCMCEAGDFLPFKLTTDVESTFRWYGLPYEEVMAREKPISLDWDNLSESNIEWLQCMVIENEYLLPSFPEADGSKPKGIRADGVNGIVTDELKAAIDDYRARYRLETDQEFLDHIEKKVIKGVY